MSTQPTLYLSRRSFLFPRERVAVYWVAVEFHGLVVERLASLSGGHTTRNQLDRATLNVALNIGEAAASSNRRAQTRLAAARAALDKAFSLLEALVVEQRVPLTLYEELRRWATRVVAGITQLAATPVEKWPALRAPALEPIAVAKVRDAAVVAILRSITPLHRPPTPPGPDEPAPMAAERPSPYTPWAEAA
jgi:hypothetical protein